MRGCRTERLIRMASQFIHSPAKNFSLTDWAKYFNVSKTIISDDIEVINSAMSAEGYGALQVDRGRSGGAKFVAACSEDYRRKILERLAVQLSNPERLLPGGLIYYSDLIFDPETALPLGFAMASLFTEKNPDIVVTSEVKGIPIALFTAYALGCPLAVCRFRNRPSDGAAMAVHYPIANGEVRTMYMGTRQVKRGSRVLIVDDFMRGGSTVAGMHLMAKQFEADVVGTGVFVAAEEPKKKAVPDYKALLSLTVDGRMKLA